METIGNIANWVSLGSLLVRNITDYADAKQIFVLASTCNTEENLSLSFPRQECIAQLRNPKQVLYLGLSASDPDPEDPEPVELSPKP